MKAALRASLLAGLALSPFAAHAGNIALDNIVAPGKDGRDGFRLNGGRPRVPLFGDRAKQFRREAEILE